jgi:predicted amidohydrolase
MSKFKMALVQQSVPDSFEEAIEKSVALLREAAGQGAKVVLFPEIQLSPFFPQYRGQEASRYLVDLAHPVLKRFRAVCREFGIVAVPNFYWRENGRAFDASPVIGCDGTVLGISKMVHVAQVP